MRPRGSPSAIRPPRPRPRAGISRSCAVPGARPVGPSASCVAKENGTEKRGGGGLRGRPSTRFLPPVAVGRPRPGRAVDRPHRPGTSLSLQFRAARRRGAPGSLDGAVWGSAAPAPTPPAGAETASEPAKPSLTNYGASNVTGFIPARAGGRPLEGATLPAPSPAPGGLPLPCTSRNGRVLLKLGATSTLRRAARAGRVVSAWGPGWDRSSGPQLHLFPEPPRRGASICA